MSGDRTAAERVVVVALAGGLVVYTVLALVAHRWVSGFVAPLVAGLLVARHSRARFSAYVFFSALAFRGLIAGAWPLALFAAASVVAMQTPPAVRVWPRVGRRPGTRGPDASSTCARACSRMSTP